jgi:hypothetical protein
MTTPHDELMLVLEHALSIKRRADSWGETGFVAWLAQRLPITAIDMAGNIHVDLRQCTHGMGANKTLFVAHTDTITRGRGGPNAIVKDGHLWKTDGKDTLGADDGAGVAVMCALIKARVPAYYVFTRGEEIGGHGSRHLAEEWVDLLSEFDRAIAVDRRDVFSVITHQFAGRCCSSAFGEALCDALNERGMLMMTDDTGVYTDTAEFMEIIPECTNISAGYNHEHGAREELDVEYLQNLLTAMLTVEWDELPVDRDPMDGGAEDEKLEDLTGYQEALDRWMAEEKAAELEAFDLHELKHDPFAWSDDGRTINTGSGKRRRVRALS